MTSAIDFWICKNIVGRKLVHMRWWYIIDNEGNERWHFESKGKAWEVTSKDDTVLFQDRLVFWGTLILHPVIWGLFFVMNAITIKIFEVKFFYFKWCSRRSLSYAG